MDLCASKPLNLALIDSHCHLDLPAFDEDLDHVIQRANDAGIIGFHIPGTTVDGWYKQRKIAQKHRNIDLSFGLHPYFLDDNHMVALAHLTQVFTDNTQAVAVGEIGLDAVCKVSWEKQRYVFEQQLNLAKELALPVIVHHRKTHQHILHSLKKTNFGFGGIIHAFSGSYETAKRYIDKGFVLGIGGTITYSRAVKTRKAIAGLSLDDLVLETDSPDMPIYGYQGMRNEPARLVHVLTSLSSLLQVPAEELMMATTRNYHRVLSSKIK